MDKLVIANWKSNPPTLDEAVELAKATDIKGAIISPPDIYLQALKNNLTNAELCAQNMFWEDTGSYTGETSWRHLKNLDIKYAIIGHSERRNYLNETDEMVNKKFKAALNAGITPILCVGESAEIRDKGIDSAKEFVKNQIEKALDGIQASELKTHNSPIIAYEPIWAIGTGAPATPESASQMSIFIKSLLTTTYDLEANVLYGGSVDSSNASSFFKEEDIDGALVGGASLKADEFKKLVELA